MYDKIGKAKKRAPTTGALKFLFKYKIHRIPNKRCYNETDGVAPSACRLLAISFNSALTSFPKSLMR